MAITEQRTINSNDGIKKTIDAQSMPMALDILQRGLYSAPVPSTIRELCSNAYDSIKERNVARDILENRTTVDDHYDTSLGEDGIYHSSGWEPKYYDLDYLSNDDNVVIYYEEGKLEDTLRIVDNGVGLGGYRLRKFFDLNWSSKRANKDTLGRLGLGSKVALSFVDSFRMYSNYNGKRFGFDIYLDKFESSVPKFGGSGINDHIILQEAAPAIPATATAEMIPELFKVVAHYEKTDKMNGVEIVVAIKKFNKNRLFDAVKEQLMYLPNIIFKTKARGDIAYTEVPVQAQVQYRDKDIVISKSTILDTPHILLGTGDALINYGQVNFVELELAPKRGSVGLILDINDVEVTPSREGLIWSPKTRAAVVRTYDKATNTACNLVNATLKAEKDYLKWLVSADNVLGSIKNSSSSSSKNVLGELASIINSTDIKDVTFSGNKTIKFESSLAEMLGEFFTIRRVKYDHYGKKVLREKCDSISSLNKRVFITKGSFDKLTDLTILGSMTNDYLVLKLKEGHELNKYAMLVLASSAYDDYDAIEVDQDIVDTFLVNEIPDAADGDDTDSVVTTIDAAKQRRLNKEIVCHSYDEYSSVFRSSTYKISEVNNKYEGCDKIIYGSFNDRADVKKVLSMFDSKHYLTANKYSRKEFNTSIGFVHAVLLAKNNMKHLKSCYRYVSLSNFVVNSYDEESKTLVFQDHIKDTLTLPFVKIVLQKMYMDNPYVFGTFEESWVVDLDPELQELAEEIQKVRRNPITPFYMACGMLQLMNAGLIPHTPEERQDNIDIIEDEMPDYLCDNVDAVEEVSMLNLTIYNTYVAKFMEYEKIYSLMYQFKGNLYLNDKYKIETSIELLKTLKGVL